MEKLHAQSTERDHTLVQSSHSAGYFISQPEEENIALAHRRLLLGWS